MKQRIGSGNTADVYAYGDLKVCKLFVDGYPESAIQREYNHARRMMDLGVPVPVCYGMFRQQNRMGIIYERIFGESLLDFFIRSGDAKFTVGTLVSLHQKIIHRHAEGLSSYKQFLRQCIQKKNAELLKEIDKLPDGNSLCHGDYHPGNVLLGQDGGVTLIDFMNVCRGPWQYDVARTYFLIKRGALPGDIPYIETMEALQPQLATNYISAMNVHYDEIARFVEVISEVRRYELANLV
ncbi:aminoglycoside phosphotransferase family protein [Ornithinibacillus gellani]|uniref:aminoglycoside phosphotransferase family protein n=1 Tax=Ornithinibacillus gellani TaxID=2293253 RepID=UPI000F461F35|nr:aminoglycoside phosphotransferase family protein [Ornithinibacillus gellani]TQS70545.1 aminoglycoside phosphotransferase family protein [Ornithinibacillus gellani]